MNVIHVQFQRNHSLNPSKTGVLSCTAQNRTCSQEFQPRVPPSSVQLHVSPATAVSNATRCLCPFQLWQVVQGTPAQVPLHHFFVLRIVVVSVNCVCLERFPAHLQCQEVYHTTRRMCRSRRKQVFSVFCLLVFSPNASHLHFPLAVLHPPAFVPSRRQCLEPLRVLTLHVLNKPVSQQAVQRLLDRLISCLSVELAACPQAVGPSISSCVFVVIQVPVNSSIEAFATKSSARQYFSAGSPSSSSVGSTSALFRVSSSASSILVLSPVSSVGAVLLNLFVSSTTAGS